MIKVIIELWPHGDENRKKLLSIINIANDGTGTELRGNYKAKFGKADWIEKIVEDYPRTSYHVNKLLYLVLKKKYG